MVINIKFMLFVVLVFPAIAIANEMDEKKLLESIFENPDSTQQYWNDEKLSSIDTLKEIENEIANLKALSKKYPDEPKIYFAISRFYSVRGEIFSRELVYKDRDDFFSLPVVQENLSGIRDNLTEVVKLLEANKGNSIKAGAIRSTVISLQLEERIQRLYLKQNPDGLVCNDPDNQECMPQSYEELAMETLEVVADQYQGYGYFDDADRVLNDIENLSEAGKAKVAELRPAYIEGRKTWSPEQVAEYSFLKVEGGTPKPLTIRGVEAIEENHKAALEKARLRKETAAVTAVASSQAQSSAASSIPTEPASNPVAESHNRLILIGAGIILLLLIGFIALRRRK